LSGRLSSCGQPVAPRPPEGVGHHDAQIFAPPGNQRTVEALFDNQPWEAGMQNLAALDWQDSQGYYSVRNFLMLKPLA